MLVRDRMSRKVVHVEPETTPAKAAALLKRHRIRHLPVMRRERLVGIVTAGDLRAARKDAAAVKEVMTPNPVTISPDAAVDEAARVLRDRKLNGLPVVEGGRVLGILTVSDVLDAFVALSGVAESTYRFTVEGAATRAATAEIRRIVERARGELRWLHTDARRGQIHLRLKVRDVEELRAALEAGGFEVTAIVAPGPGRG